MGDLYNRRDDALRHSVLNDGRPAHRRHGQVRLVLSVWSSDYPKRPLPISRSTLRFKVYPCHGGFKAVFATTADPESDVRGAIGNTYGTKFATPEMVEDRMTEVRKSVWA